MGCEDLAEAGMVELFESHAEELTPEDMTELTQKRNGRWHRRDTLQQNHLTRKRLTHYLMLVNQVIKEGINLDPNLKCSLQIGNMITSSVSA